MTLILATALVLAIPITSPAGALYPPPGGWGTDCVNWTHMYAPVTTNHLIYDPTAGYFRDCVTGVEVIWPEFQFDLWIELEVVVHFDYSEVQIHRVSLYDNVEFIIPGWIEQNSGNYILVNTAGKTDPNGRLYDLDYMNFIEDIFGRTTMPTHGRDIPVYWSYSLDGTNYLPMDDYGVDGYGFLIEEPCTHNFWYKVMIDVDLHEKDGFYKMAGDLCPLPLL